MRKHSYDIVRYPKTLPISPEQLDLKVREIYEGLVMVEARCIEVNHNLASSIQSNVSAQRWQALIILHRTLLHEHHDFLLVSQHPIATPTLQQLALKYDMPTRMWLHGVQSLLEVLQHHLPASLDFMLDFLYMSYSMIALLYETIPAFANTWVECLGKLSQYRMALGRGDIQDQKVWTYNAHNWYSKASDRAPTTGRLYHYRAILSGSDALQELCLHSKSLCVANPFDSARTSILTLFDPVLVYTGRHRRKLPPLETHFVRAHGMLFKQEIKTLDDEVAQFLHHLNLQMIRVASHFTEQGYLIAISNICTVLDFGAKGNAIMRSMEGMSAISSDGEADIMFEHSRHLHHATLAVVLNHIGNQTVLPFLHVVLVFMRYIAHSPCAMGLWEARFPWVQMATMLNTLVDYPSELVEHDEFPKPACPLPEDHAMRGLLWTTDYFPEDWFIKEVENDEKSCEREFTTPQRKERILWLAYHIAICDNSRIHWNSGKGIFWVDLVETSIEGAPEDQMLASRLRGLGGTH